MRRRGHTKSRRGCVQCKLRHVKCDEGRPACSLCTVSARQCSFMSEAPADSPSSSSLSRRRSLAGISTSSVTPRETSTLLSDTSRALYSPTPEGLLNLRHIHLLVHLTSSKDIFDFGATPHRASENSAALALALQKGLQDTYLLYQLLAFSARHLACLHPSQSETYLEQAIALQTHGVSLFNVAQLSQVDRSNCVSFLIYSGILGHHLLADALSFRDQPIDEFLAEYAWCARLHRGVRTIAASSWPLLMESELTGMLSWSQEYLLRKPTGQECSRIRVMVATSASLTGGERQACMEAIDFLQVGFDSVLSADWEELGKEAGSKGNKHQMTYSWSVVVAPEFMALLVDKRPESLVVLGYFCVLLHYARETWQIRDAGRYVFEMVEQCLGEAWRCWLDWPRRMIASD
ncbi:hypothetical protein QC762_704340 [Podospora pseudocomata]|uniref:Zn(2)-C6 fungal-type domain-containing protein n=1 Tax=Podospora pseudocomata TaxID=2093779 RepID=A0ABR0G2C4_9PEZI|nr:hypothetical protein QC762_704340 [Podospora pseudocomata]